MPNSDPRSGISMMDGATDTTREDRGRRVAGFGTMATALVDNHREDST